MTSTFIRTPTMKSDPCFRIDLADIFRIDCSLYLLLCMRRQNFFLFVEKKAGAHGSLLHPVTRAAFLLFYFSISYLKNQHPGD
jgi:hypothetical protein